MNDPRMNRRRGGRWIHYDKTGEPIEFERWVELVEDRDYRQVAATLLAGPEAEEILVSTVWLGTDHNWTGQGPPIMFETMCFGGEHDLAQMRYATEQEAIDGHLRTVEDIRAGRPLWFEVTEDAEK